MKKTKSPVSLTLIPTSPITVLVPLDVRAGVRNFGSVSKSYETVIYLDGEDEGDVLYEEVIEVAGGSAGGVRFLWQTKGQAGRHKIIFVAKSGSESYREERPIEVFESDIRSTKRIDGSWASITHWSPEESKFFQEDLERMTDGQWREMIRAMHEVGMDMIVIQEMIRNQAHVNNHNIEAEGYHGRAYYDSKLFGGRVEMAAVDPLEAILDEADKLDMCVFPGVGCYVWFDFTPASLRWHKDVADELWEMYGHHRSFYGWYVSEEVCGNLGETEQNRRDIVDFFEEFTAYCRGKTPDKPVVLAPNCHGVPGVAEVWPRVLKNLDILCPFGFHRMPEGDLSGEEAAELMQRLCDESDCHMWLDMEVFLFGEKNALYPRPIEGVLSDMLRFPNFEKILCYQYPGLMNAPWASIRPGGERTVKLFNDYKKYLGK